MPEPILPVPSVIELPLGWPLNHDPAGIKAACTVADRWQVPRREAYGITLFAPRRPQHIFGARQLDRKPHTIEHIAPLAEADTEVQETDRRRRRAEGFSGLS